MKEYRCPIYMTHTAQLVDKWRADTAEPVPESPMAQVSFGYVQRTLEKTADELEAALRQDQHELFHEAEFHDGCDLCDNERKEA